MDSHSNIPAGAARPWLIGIALLAGLAIAAAFAGWLHFGSSILLDMAAAGLSWCF